MPSQKLLHVGGKLSFQGKPGKAPEDVPAPASGLRTAEEIELEHLRETLRMAREERKSFGWLRKGFVLVFAVLFAVAGMAVFTLAVALVRGPVELVVPALSVLAGTGGAGMYFWRMYAERIRARP